MSSIKQNLEKQLQARLDEWKAEIDQAEAKAGGEKARAEAEKADAEVQKQLWSKVDDLKKKVTSAQQRLDELRKLGEDKAASIKGEIERLVA